MFPVKSSDCSARIGGQVSKGLNLESLTREMKKAYALEMFFNKELFLALREVLTSQQLILVLPLPERMDYPIVFEFGLNNPDGTSNYAMALRENQMDSRISDHRKATTRSLCIFSFMCFAIGLIGLMERSRWLLAVAMSAWICLLIVGLGFLWFAVCFSLALFGSGIEATFSCWCTLAGSAPIFTTIPFLTAILCCLVIDVHFLLIKDFALICKLTRLYFDFDVET